MSITREEFDINKVVFLDAKTDSYGNVNVDIKYERNGKQGPISFNWPLLRTDGNGVTGQAGTGGSVSHSVKVVFPRNKPVFVEDKDPETQEVIGGHYEEPDFVMVPSDPDDPESEQVEKSNAYEEAQAWVDIVDQIYQKAIDYCLANRQKLKIDLPPKCKPENQRVMVESQVKSPIYRKFLENGEEDPKYPPSIYLKFIESGVNGSPPNTVYTNFMGADQKPINWRTLENTLMYFLPTSRVERIFLGAKKNIQCKVTKAIVLETKPREELSEDNKVLQEILASNPGVAKAFLNSLGNLEKYREVKRESDIVKKPRSPEIKAQPVDNLSIDANEGEDSNGGDSPKNKESNSGSLLEGFLQKQGSIPPAKRVIPKRPITNK